jgi:hypothetical protein
MSVIEYSKVKEFRTALDDLWGCTPEDLTSLLKELGLWDENLKTSPFVETTLKMREQLKKNEKMRDITKIINTTLQSKFPSKKNFDYRLETKPSDVLKKITNNQAKVRNKGNWWSALWGSLGSFVAMASVGLLDNYYSDANGRNFPILFPALAATAMNICSLPEFPGSQPRNIYGGQTITLVIAISLFLGIGNIPWLSTALTVGLSVAIMDFLNLHHPPATSLAASFLLTPSLHQYQYQYIGQVLIATTMIFITGMITNNIPKFRSYPARW